MTIINKMNSTQKRTGSLKAHKFANTDSRLYQKRTNTASTSKAMGKSDTPKSMMVNP